MLFWKYIAACSYDYLRYIHGGAWRDPEVDSKSFQSAVDVLWGSNLRPRIAGFASINYRLSPYPGHSRFPSSPDDPSRNVRHPTHIEDVEKALLYLDEKYQISGRYLLSGHSAGGALVFQVSSAGLPKPLPRPACVLGISGIYDLNAFVWSHSHPAYKEIAENAFPNLQDWEKVSPSVAQKEGTIWEGAKVIIISQSKSDELVEEAQPGYMLDLARSLPDVRDKVHFLEATGAHDDIWGKGDILAGLIIKSVELLDASK